MRAQTNRRLVDFHTRGGEFHPRSWFHRLTAVSWFDILGAVFLKIFFI
jgi:hypothetical protein